MLTDLGHLVLLELFVGVRTVQGLLYSVCITLMFEGFLF